MEALDTKKVFAALPKINVIWVKGGEFHLHPNNGGVKVERIEEVIEEAPIGEVIEEAPNKNTRKK